MNALIETGLRAYWDGLDAGNFCYLECIEEWEGSFEWWIAEGGECLL